MTHTDPATPWPPLEAYALAHRCPTCKAPTGEPCDAPRKAAAEEPGHRLHLTRQDAGARHYRKDVGDAPWPEERVPGQRYDSLGELWDPAAS